MHFLDYLKIFFETNTVLGHLTFALGIIILALISYALANRFLLRGLKYLAHKTKNQWDDILIQQKVFDRLVKIVPATIFYIFAYTVPTFETAIHRISLSCIILTLTLTFGALLNGLNTIYTRYEVSKEKPIKGILQTVSILAYFLGAIVIAATILGKSPTILLSGIGAMTAVLMLVFKDTILGFVAGLQISFNRSIKKGDWIVMPQYGADGNVIDIALHNITVQNWDKTITVIPSHKLLDESFTNWRGMEESGGRRICRSVYIDMETIRILSDEEIESLKKVDFLKDYMIEKQNEIAESNKEKNIDLSIEINGRRMTNVGTFRAYMLNYLRAHPGIRNDMTLLVRQLAPTSEGLPLQIYAFTSTTEWARYEGIQSDIFDHVISVAPNFSLRVFQKPSGNDFRHLGETK